MTKEDLRPIPFKKGDPRTLRIAKMGGSASNKNGRNAVSNKLAWMRKHGTTDQQANELMNLMENYKYSTFDILKNIKHLKDGIQDNKEEAVVIDKMMAWHKLHHGEKKQIDFNIKTLDLNKPLSEDMKTLLLDGVIDEEIV